MIKTRWGYAVNELPLILSLEEFNKIGGAELSSSDDAKLATLNAVSTAIRDYCGWHVAPNVTCQLEISPNETYVLPIMAVSDADFGEITTRNVTVASSGVVSRKRVYVQTITCKAGIEDASVLKQVAYQLATNHLVATAGLREEHIGSAGATYNQTDTGVSGGVRLLESDRALLEPYRIVEVV
jgi:hypothetical protein